MADFPLNLSQQSGAWGDPFGGGFGAGWLDVLNTAIGIGGQAILQHNMGPLYAGSASGAANGGAAMSGGACAPARPRMPSSMLVEDPCAPTNPTAYIKAGKVSSALWPGVIASQARKLSTANKRVPKRVTRRRKS